MINSFNVEFGRRKVAVILQTEAAECGLASLAMVSSWHGYRIDLATLRGRFPLSIKGANLAQLIHYADKLQLSCRPVRLELNELKNLKMPCILHWRMNHFVVLTKVRKNGVIINDPSIGIRHLPYEIVSQNFTGIALEISPTSEFKPANETRRIALGALVGRIQGLWWAMGTLFLLALALEVFALTSPLFNQWVVDEALTSADRDLLNVLVWGFALMLAIQTAISLARGWAVLYLSTHLNLQWVANVFTHLLRLPVAWFEKRHLGDIVSRFGSIGAIQHTLTTGFVEAVLDGLLAVATFAMMMLYSPQLSSIVLLACIAYGSLRGLAYRPLREASEEALVLGAKEQSCFMETIRGVQAIKLFGRELERRGRWTNLVVDAINREVRTEKFMLFFGIANTGVFALEKLLIFWVGAGMVMQGEFTIGMLFAFTAYGGQFGGRMSSLIDTYFAFRMLSLHAERLADIVLSEKEQDSPCNATIENLEPRIELNNISFRHADNEPWIFRNLTLKIEAGESIAIVGPSGCGKTTLIKLILGILPPTEGDVRYGGVTIADLGPYNYRQAVGAVMQDDQLFAGSLAENISFFDPQCDHDRIEQCARLAAIHEDIMAMPMRYHTLTGDMGTSLSGGQKQRVLLARALYKAPRVLILDEATSHLDVDRERQVNQSVSALSVTRIWVAHRPETIAAAGRVVNLDNGGRQDKQGTLQLA